MDNLSHSLAGLAAGELIQRSLRPESDAQSQSLRRRLLLVAAGVATNLPDLDLVLSPLLPAPLGYLLHHRGHTHTLLYLLPQAMLLVALLWLLWPAARRLLRASASARTGLAAATFAGLGLHLLMDYLNSYGVHPFHPFDSRWLYGDMVFILEPVFWVGFGVPLALMVPPRLLKLIFLALIGAVLAWAGAAQFLHWGSLLALVLGGAFIGAMQWRAGPTGRGALAAGMLMAAAFVGLQGWASHVAKQRVAAHLQTIGPSSRLLDTALSPFPANPLCWSFVSVERNDGAHSYRVRRGLISLAPATLALHQCPAALSQAMPGASDAIGLVSESESSLAALRGAAANCHFRAWLRFARAPVLADGTALDARFPGGVAENFSAFSLAAFENLPCQSGVPAWSLPRQDLLDVTR